MALLFILVVAALEATVVGLPLTALTTISPPWPLLLLAIALGWLADQAARRGPHGRERLFLGAGAVVGGLLLPAAHLGGPGAALAALLPGHPAFVTAYTLLLLGLYLCWRGTRLDTRDTGAVSDLFSRGAVAAVVTLILGAIAGTGVPASSPQMIGQIAALIALGLLALALAHAQDTAGGRLGDLNWRWLATLLAAVVAVVLLATLGTSLLGGGAGAQTAQALIALVLLPFALIGGALAWLFLTLFAEPLAAALRAILARLQLLQGFEPPPAQQGETGEGLGEAVATIQRLAEGATVLMALIPIAILVVAILLLRRRQRGRGASDEERESLGTLASLGADLRDLLGKLRNPFERRLSSLQTALAGLRDDDPSSRARRAYIGLLLLLEARARPRPPALTPAEFSAAAAEATGAPAPVEALTAAYEQARYSPAGAAPADAAAAEAALAMLQRRP